jgi:glycosyltransferase involved in cell wall biosynthesis
VTLLFVVPYVPDLIHVRPYQFIRGLLRRGHSIFLACPVVSDQDAAALETIASMGVRTISRPVPRLQSLLNCILALPTATPLQSVYSWRQALARDILTLTSVEAFDAIHVEHLRGVRFGMWLRRRLPDTPIVWDSVDCISGLFAKAQASSVSLFSRLVTRLEQPRTAALEADAPHHFDRVLFTAQADLDEVDGAIRSRHGAPTGNLRLIPNGVDLRYFAPSPSTTRDRFTIVMTGKMSYHANVAAARFLVDEVMPAVWAGCPEARVVLVGKNPPANLRSLARPDRVLVTGAVEDVRPYLRRAAVAAAPIVYGAGIQNKILEAMACGTPVVTTPAGASALRASEGRDFLAASSASGVATQILRLLRDPALAAGIGGSGRVFVESHHDWDVIAAQLESVYREISGSVRNLPSSQSSLAPVG